MKVAKLQKEMKEGAADYDKRKGLLESLGWTVEEFDERKERIQAIISMDTVDDMEADKEEYKKQILEIRENNFYSDQQKRKLIESMEKMQSQKKELLINTTKKDWPAVAPYIEMIKHMNAWIARNVLNLSSRFVLSDSSDSLYKVIPFK